jgi:hypothetical protein
MLEENLEPNDKKGSTNQCIYEEGELVRLCQNHLKKPMKTYRK